MVRGNKIILMGNTKLVSIALCTYNGENFLREQLDSLVNQTYTNTEIIIVDDCSKDKTFEILEEYAQKFTFIKVYKNNSNLGYVKNFERALLLCKGDYIALCDQDDIWIEDKIKLQVEGIGDNMLIYHDSEFITDHGNSMNKKMSDIKNMYQGQSYKVFLFFNCVSGHAVLMKKELIKYCLPFPKNIYYDQWLAYSATNNGGVVYLNKVLVKYRQHVNSETNILKIKKTKRIKVLKNKQAAIELAKFQEFNKNTKHIFINKLIKLYEEKESSWICISLIVFLYKYYTSLLYISKKSTISNMNFIFKNIWGGKLKRFMFIKS